MGVAVGVPVGVPVGVGVGVPVGVPVGLGVRVPVGVEVGGTPVDVAVGGILVGVFVSGATSFVTVAVHLMNEPPPLAEPLHWSTCTGKVTVVVDAVLTAQLGEPRGTAGTRPPPLPEPLHCPTVAVRTDAAVLLAAVGSQTSPGVSGTLTHWYTVADVNTPDGAVVKRLVTVTVHHTPPPPPLPEPLHICTDVIG